jgi:hypothetical protein
LLLSFFPSFQSSGTKPDLWDTRRNDVSWPHGGRPVPQCQVARKR